MVSNYMLKNIIKDKIQRLFKFILNLYWLKLSPMVLFLHVTHLGLDMEMNNLRKSINVHMPYIRMTPSLWDEMGTTATKLGE